MKTLLTFLCFFLAATAPAGELYQRYEAWRAHSEHTQATKPAKSTDIIAVGIERTTDFYHTLPAYEAVLDYQSGVHYRGTGQHGKVGEYTGSQTNATDFHRLAEYITNSDFFDLPDTIEMQSTHHPDYLITVWTAEGEKSVLDRNFPDQLHPTVWAAGKLTDGILFNAAFTEENQVRLTAELPKAPLAPDFPNLEEKLHQGSAITVACLGDSVTGVYYHTGGRRAYTDMLKLEFEHRYPGVPITTINAGISGNTTVDALGRIDADVLSHKPDLVTIMFGLNDMTRVDLADYRSNLLRIVTLCRAAGAEVLLCTPNAVEDTPGRPTEKLLQYVAVVREVAQSENVPLADCYAATEDVRARRLEDWMMLMSDEIHPNMAGHKLLARTMATTIGRKLPIGFGIPAPEPMIPRTLTRIEAKQPIRILAMPPYDELLPKVLKELAPESKVTATTWEVAGKTMSELEADAKAVRDNPPDLVFIAVPAETPAESFERYKRHFTWVMNWSLSFGHQEWDVVAVPPSFTAPVEGDAAERDAWQKTLIRAQDFKVLQGSAAPLEQRLRVWLKSQRD